MLISLKNDTYKLIIDSQADKYLMKLSKKNKKDLKTILNSIKKISNNPYNSAILKGGVKKERRVRQGDYRIIFRINKETKPHQIRIIKIGKRTNVYK